MDPKNEEHLYLILNEYERSCRISLSKKGLQIKFNLSNKPQPKMPKDDGNTVKKTTKKSNPNNAQGRRVRP